METQSPIQPRQDELINIPLTLEEIFSLAGEFTSKRTSFKSEIFGDEKNNSEFKIAKNPRTGIECKFAYNGYPLPYDTYLDFYPYLYEIIVEINTGKFHIICSFEATDPRGDDVQRFENEALKTFERWSILIGAKPVERVLI